MLDLSANVNPEDIPSALWDALPELLREARRYPDLEYQALRQQIARYLQREEGLQVRLNQILPGNGAVSLLDAALSLERQVLMMRPAFSEYEASCRRHGIPCHFLDRPPKSSVVLGDAEATALKDKLREGPDISALILCHPNNPDGKRWDRQSFSDLLAFCQARGVRILLDATFSEYLPQEQRLTDYGRQHPFLVEIRALTKFFGLPGLRLGYALSSDEGYLEKLSGRMTPWAVGTFAAGLGSLLLQEEAFIEKSRRDNETRRLLWTKALVQSGAFERVYPSCANFLMVYSKEFEALCANLSHEGILLRSLKNLPALGEGYGRICVKKEEDLSRLLRALASVSPKNSTESP